MIKELLLHALNSTMPTPRHKAVSTPLNDAAGSGSATEGGEERTTPLSGGCYLGKENFIYVLTRIFCAETFIPLGNCTDMGEEVSWNHESLCSGELKYERVLPNRKSSYSLSRHLHVEWRLLSEILQLHQVQSTGNGLYFRHIH